MKALEVLEIHQHLRSYNPSGFPPRNMNISFCILMLKNVDTHSPRQQISCCHNCMTSEGTRRERQKALTNTCARVGPMPPSMCHSSLYQQLTYKEPQAMSNTTAQHLHRHTPLLPRYSLRHSVCFIRFLSCSFK